MDDLVPWLRVRIAEDRLRADLLAEDFTVTVEADDVVDAVYTFANQRAVLARCDSSTAVLDEYELFAPHDNGNELYWLKFAVLAAGLAYQHHPGYREEWRPSGP